MPGATVTLTNTGTGLVRAVTTDSNGEFTAPSLPTGKYLVKAELSGFKTVTVPDVDARRRSALPAQPEARDRRGRGIGDRHRRVAADPDVHLGAGHDRFGGADQDAAAQRTKLRQPDAHGARRGARRARREHRRRGQPGVARLGVVLGQRPAAARQQLHARRRRQQRDLAADGGPVPERRRARRVQAADQHLLGRVRPLAGRRRQPADQVGRQQDARQRLRVPAQLEVRREQLLQRSRRTAEARFQPAPVRRHDQRPDREGQDVLLLRLSGLPRQPGRELPVDGALGEDARGRFLRAQPRHLRSADAPAVSGQRDPGQPVRPGLEEHPEPVDSRSGHRRQPQRDRADHQQLPDQPDTGAAGQPDRSQSRSLAHVLQPLLRALQLREDASRSCPRRCRTATPGSPSAPAKATSRRRGLRSTTPTRSARTC